MPPGRYRAHIDLGSGSERNTRWRQSLQDAKNALAWWLDHGAKIERWEIQERLPDESIKVIEESR